MKKANHVFIGGETGSGKTFFAASKFRQIKGFKIFVNTAHVDYVKPLGYNVSSASEIPDLEETSIILNPVVENLEDDIKFLRQWLFSVGEELGGKYFVDVFFDEIHLISSGKRPNIDLDTFFTQGRGTGIVAWGISQRPALVSQTVITQTITYYFFRVSQFEEMYFKRHGIDLGTYRSHLARNYCYIKITGGRTTLHTPIKDKKMTTNYKIDE